MTDQPKVQNQTGPAPSRGTQSAAFEMLMNAIGNQLISTIQQLVNSDPSLVHFKGWAGMSPLHRACLIGDYNIVLLLVQANADVNALTAFNETPIHYASRRGMPTVVHLLLQCGAKIELRDKKGRSALHHAAESGAVDVVRYFQDAFNLDLQTLDNNYQSALHIACAHGHLELFFYLINTGCGNLTQPDIEGNLPIHITSKQGYGNMTWTMLRQLGVSVLKQRNKKGMTPLDLASQSDGFGYDELVPMLQHYTGKPDNTPITGPVFEWYARMALPAGFYLLLVFISQQLESKQYLVFAVGLSIAYLFHRKLGHRMNDVSRWPEPLHTGFFYGGILHTTFCFFWVMFPYSYTVWWALALALSAIPSLHYVYYKILTTDPGLVATTSRDPVTGKVLTMVDLCQMSNPPYWLCHICNLIQGQRTKHCRLCGRCYYGMDHHCLFILRCVAHGNHALFVQLLLLSAVNMALYCLSFGLYVNEIFAGLSWTETWFALINTQAWPLTLLILNSASFVWCVIVLHVQIEVAASGRTAYFNKPPTGMTLRTLSKLQLFVNFVHFLLEQPLPHTPFRPEDKAREEVKKVSNFTEDGIGINTVVNVV